jgi:hypothetical protein
MAVMLAPTSFPEWLPPVVAMEAEEHAQERPDYEELLRRLATDARMESVWRELKKHKLYNRINWERWSHGGKPTGLSNEDFALMLIFRRAFFHAMFAMHDYMTAAYPTVAEHKARHCFVETASRSIAC